MPRSCRVVVASDEEPVLAHGFVIAKCESCEREELVAFSCNKRGFCGSCIGCRMRGTAAHLVESVLPEVPVRQWVASYGWQLRYLMGYDRHLASEVQGAFAQTVSDRVAWLIKGKLHLKSVSQVKTAAYCSRSDSILNRPPCHQNFRHETCGTLSVYEDWGQEAWFVSITDECEPDHSYLVAQLELVGSRSRATLGRRLLRPDQIAAFEAHG